MTAYDTYKTQNTLRTWEGYQEFLISNFIFATAIDLYKCLKQIKLPISLYTCAPIAPFDISTMDTRDRYEDGGGS